MVEGQQVYTDKTSRISTATLSISLALVEFAAMARITKISVSRRVSIPRKKVPHNELLKTVKLTLGVM